MDRADQKYRFDDNNAVEQVGSTSIMDIDKAEGPQNYAKKQLQFARAKEQAKQFKIRSSQRRNLPKPDELRKERNLLSSRVTFEGKRGHDDALQQASVVIGICSHSQELVRDLHNFRIEKIEKQLRNIQDYKSNKQESK